MGSSAKSLRTVICLLRNDLRIHDNEALLWAHRNADHVVPLYCFDPDHFKAGTWHFNFPKTGVHRANFILESVQDLRANLRRRNSDLLVLKDTRPSEAIKKIVEACQASSVVSVVYQKEVTYEEVNVEQNVKNFCKNSGIKVEEVWGLSLYHINDLPFKRVPDTYTQFRKEVEERSRGIRPLLQMPEQFKPPPPGLVEKLTSQNMPDLPTLIDEPSAATFKKDKRTVFPFSGGESAALERLHEYLWGSHAVATYKETRNGFLGNNYSTKFSPWLATGSLSPRQIYWDIKSYERTEVANNSTYWVIFELIWRDYFKFVCRHYGDSVFYLTGIMDKRMEWSQDMTKFRAWKEGRTGVPFIDANMREMKETGWMSNRGRQNVASFLIKDLGLDWRLGAEWFESQLLDHDVCSNYGNWNYAAGIGNDPREGRKFNIVKQGLDYDADGDYVRVWVPELAGVRGGQVHHPWTMSGEALSRCGVEIGVDYPKAMHIAPEWSRHTNKKTSPNQGGKQRGIDFYFKSNDGSKPAVGAPNSGGGARQAKKNKKFPNKGSRIQH